MISVVSPSIGRVSYLCAHDGWRLSATRARRVSSFSRNSSLTKTPSAPAPSAAWWRAGAASPVRAIKQMFGSSRRSRAIAVTPSSRPAAMFADSRPPYCPDPVRACQDVAAE